LTTRSISSTAASGKADIRDRRHAAGGQIRPERALFRGGIRNDFQGARRGRADDEAARDLDAIEAVFRKLNAADEAETARRDAEKLSGIALQTKSKWARRLRDIASYRIRLYGPSYKAAMGAMAASELVQQSMSNEHYTPAKYIEAARDVLGGIDLDPASCEAANGTVRAAKFFDAEHSGLVEEWHGRVWLNPSYGDLVGKFIEKLALEMSAGRVAA
jgi:hypothetical protein